MSCDGKRCCGCASAIQCRRSESKLPIAPTARRRSCAGMAPIRTCASLAGGNILRHHMPQPARSPACVVATHHCTCANRASIVATYLAYTAQDMGGRCILAKHAGLGTACRHTWPMSQHAAAVASAHRRRMTLNKHSMHPMMPQRNRQDTAPCYSFASPSGTGTRRHRGAPSCR